jgi:rhodanese-related sulfurtransferase
MNHITEVKELYKLWQKDQSSLIFVDVRTPQEFGLGRIPRAINIDINSSDFHSKVSQLDRSKKYLVYCQSGGRSLVASQYMITQGFEVINSIPGFLAWQGSGFEITI